VWVCDLLGGTLTGFSSGISFVCRCKATSAS